MPTVDEAVERAKAVTLDQVKAVYAKQLGAGAGELAAVGDFDPKAVTAALEPALAGWKSTVAYRRIERTGRPVAGGGDGS